MLAKGQGKTDEENNEPVAKTLAVAQEMWTASVRKEAKSFAERLSNSAPTLSRRGQARQEGRA